MTRSKKLRDAAALVRSAASTLDDRQSRCKCCGMMKSENLDEAHAARSLRALAGKLDAHARTDEARSDVAARIALRVADDPGRALAGHLKSIGERMLALPGEDVAALADRMDAAKDDLRQITGATDEMLDDVEEFLNPRPNAPPKKERR